MHCLPDLNELQLIRKPSVIVDELYNRYRKFMRKIINSPTELLQATG